MLPEPTEVTTPTLPQDFIGRQTQLDAIRQCIRDAHRRFIISIYGRGGIGKTYLLREVQSRYPSQAGLFCFPIVDFSQGRTRTVQFLMKFIAEEAQKRDIGSFGHYEQTRKALERGEPSTGTPALSTEDLEEDFQNDFLAFEKQQRCILLFDTLELIQDTIVLDFLLKLAREAQNSVFILAGRRNDKLDKVLLEAAGSKCLVSLPLTGFSEASAMQYIKSHWAGARLTDEERQILYLLAEDGIPIKLALALDWLARGLMLKSLMKYSLDQLHQLRAEDAKIRSEQVALSQPTRYQHIMLRFEAELLSQISGLGSHVDRTIHVMAHVYRRFNKELLTLLIPDVKDPETVVDQLRRLPFVKFIEDDYFVLHDEMQRMVVRHIWEETDPDHEARRELSRKVVDGYYNPRLDERPTSTDDDLERRILEIERLHYELDIDLSEGYRQFMDLFPRLESDRRVELMALAVDVLLKDRFLPNRLREFVNVYYGGWVLIRRPDLAHAQQRLEEGVAALEKGETGALNQRGRALVYREVDQRLAEVYTTLGYCHRQLGSWEKAIEYYTKALTLSESLVQELRAEKKPDQERIHRAILHMAETMNDMANVRRMMGKLHEARRYCKTSLLIRERLGQDFGAGNSCYVMGMIMWELGNTSEALSYLQKARKKYQAVNTVGSELRERVWIDSYHSYIMFRTGNLDQAWRLLEKALERAMTDPSVRDEYAQMLIYRSRILREGGPRPTPEPTPADSSSAVFRLADGRGPRHDPAQALADARQALDIAKKASNDYRISECYLTLGLALRLLAERKPNEEALDKEALNQEAEQCLQEGWNIARSRQYHRLEVVFADTAGEAAFGKGRYREAFENFTRACYNAMEYKSAVFAAALTKLSQRLSALVEKHPDEVLAITDQVKEQWCERVGTAETYHTRQLDDEIRYIRQVADSVSQRRGLARDFDNALRRGAWRLALQITEQADKLPIYYHPDRATLWHQRALVYHGQNAFEDARLLCERAIRIRNQYQTDAEKLGESYLLLSRIYWKLGMTYEAVQRLKNAEEKFTASHSELGQGQVFLDRAFLLFRTHQFEDAQAYLEQARVIFEHLDRPIELASTLNLMSRIARVYIPKPDQREGGYKDADRRATHALKVLDGRDVFVEVELYLTLCILHYVWAQTLEEKGDVKGAQRELERARYYNSQGLRKVKPVVSPMLRSVYRGMEANLAYRHGRVDEAARGFLEELKEATNTKLVRLTSALDLLEPWLAQMPVEESQHWAQWYITEWQKFDTEGRFPEVVQALAQLLHYRQYIPEPVSPSNPIGRLALA